MNTKRHLFQVGSLGGYEKVDLNLLKRLIDSTIGFDSKLEEKTNEDKTDKLEEKTGSALPTAGTKLLHQTLQNLTLDNFIPHLSVLSVQCRKLGCKTRMRKGLDHINNLQAT